jgi:hypothetical protein
MGGEQESAAIGNCGFEIGEKKEQCVAPMALESLCLSFPRLSGRG